MNGGLNGWDRFNTHVQELQKAAVAKGTNLAEGAHSPDVARLKQLLTAWGRVNPLPKPLAAGANFGPATTEAVKAFQRANHIQSTGKVGDATWKALQAAAAGKT